MKKLLTCLFTLLMAVAILSPVRMSAAGNTVITVSVSERDKADGIKVNKDVDRNSYKEDELPGNFGSYLSSLGYADYFVTQEHEDEVVEKAWAASISPIATEVDGNGSVAQIGNNKPLSYIAAARNNGEYVVVEHNTKTLNGEEYYATEPTDVDTVKAGKTYDVYSAANQFTEVEVVTKEEVPGEGYYWFYADILETSKTTLAELDGSEWIFSIRTGNVELANGTFDKVMGTEFEAGKDYQVVISLYYDHYSDDSTVKTAANYADDTDDRDQDFYSVYLETKPDTGLYEEPVTYVLDAGSDIAKLVAADKLVNLPGLNDATGEDDQYMYVYTVKGDKIYANWEKVDENSVKDETPADNTLDKDGDGVVTCDEYYGVTGLKWDATKNACVTTSGNAVVTVPNTSAR